MNRILASLWLMSMAAACHGQVVYDALYTVDTFHVSRGPTRSTMVLDRAELAVDYDGAAQGLAWLTARVDVGHMNGRSLTARTGDVQGISNIEGPNAFRLFNLWVAATHGPFGLKAGVIDLNTEFDTQDVAALFINGSHGTGPDLSHTGRNGPSVFPNMGTGALASYTAANNVIAKLGVFDAVPNDPDHPHANRLHQSGGDGALVIGSLERRFFVDTRLAAGAWAWSPRYPTLADGTPGPHWASRGGWAIVETPLVPVHGAEPRATGWLRIGATNSRFDPVRSYLGTGVVFRGLTRQERPQDSLGIAIARAGLSTPAVASHETTFELSYRRRLGSLITLQPDLQYVRRPAGGAGHALAIGLRLSIEKGSQPLS